MKHIIYNIYRETSSPSIFYVTYSSLVVEFTISNQYEIETAKDIQEILKIPTSSLQSWRGQQIEKFLLRDLANGTVCCKYLENHCVQQNHENISSKIAQMGPLNAPSKIIQAESEIKNELFMFIPLSKTFPAIDAVLVVPNERMIFYVQVTVALQHSIKWQFLKNLYEKLNNRREFVEFDHMLLFVVTDDIFDDFTLQPFVNPGKKKLRNNEGLPQYVAKIIRTKETIITHPPTQLE